MPRKSRVEKAKSLHDVYNFTNEPYLNNPLGFEIQHKYGKQYVKETANKGGKAGD